MKTEPLELYARSAYAPKPFLQEWFVFILLALAIKLACMAFSIFAGFFYFQSLLAPVLENPRLVFFFSALALVCIEALNAIFISKTAKFFIRRQTLPAFITLSAAVLVFYISFVSSANGLALRQSGRIDVNQSILHENRINLDSVSREFDKDIQRIENMIQTVKDNPAGWQGGERSVLTSSQLKRIDSYYSDIKALQSKKETEVSRLRLQASDKTIKNDKNKALEASKYYSLVSIVLIILTLVNSVLMWFWSKIYKEKEPEKPTLVMDEFQAKLQNTLRAQVDARVSLAYEQLLNSFTGAKHQASMPEKTKSQAPALQGQKLCKNCGQEFTPPHRLSTFCSTVCRENFWKAKK